MKPIVAIVGRRECQIWDPGIVRLKARCLGVKRYSTSFQCFTVPFEVLVDTAAKIYRSANSAG